jgi:hypothetical protein
MVAGMRSCVPAWVLLVTLCATAGVRVEEAAPWAGTWRLDPARSTERPGRAPYARTTLRIEPHDDGWLVAYDMVGTRGGRTHIEWRGRFDGKDYPVQGVDDVMTNAYRPIDERSYEIAVKLDGRAVATTRVSVSPDGATLTAVTVERDESRVVTTTAVYARQ